MLSTNTAVFDSDSFVLCGRERPNRFCLSFRDLESGDIPTINSFLTQEYGNYPYLLNVSAVNNGICLVAVEAETGRVVGFERSTPYKPYLHVWELCSLIIDPSSRHRGVARGLTQACMERLKQTGRFVLACEPVTNRPDYASQKTYFRAGFCFTGILPCMHPGVKAEELGQPESLLLSAAVIDGEVDFGHRRIFLPVRYAAVPGLLLPRFIRRRGWSKRVSGTMPEPVFLGTYEVDGVVGSEFADVGVNWSEAIEAITTLVAQGYRLAGFLPGFGLTRSGKVFDVLRLYRSPGSVNFAVVHVLPFLAGFKDFMRRDLES